MHCGHPEETLKKIYGWWELGGGWVKCTIAQIFSGYDEWKCVGVENIYIVLQNLIFKTNSFTLFAGW